MKAVRRSTILVILSYLGFISIGLPDGLLGVAWPSMRAYFRQPVDSLGLLLVMFTAGYFISSFRSGWFLARIHTGLLLAFSCLAAAISLCGFALSQNWWIVVLLSAFGGFGSGAIDAVLNTFAAENLGRRTVNWLHAFYGVGAAGGPLLMASLFTAGHPWQYGYAIVGTGLVALCICFFITGRFWRQDSLSKPDKQRGAVPLAETLRLPRARLGIAAFFVYTGIEAAAGVWAYSLFTEARGIEEGFAGLWVSLYWIGLTAGRMISGAIAHRITPRNMVRYCIFGMAVGAVLLWLRVTDLLSFLGLILIGLAAAPIFPTLIAATPERLGERHTPNTIGFQIAGAVLGQSLLPALIGFMSALWTLEVVGPALLVSVAVLFLIHEPM